MSTTKVQKFTAQVINGPSAADVVNSFLYAHAENQLPVKFTVELDGKKYTVQGGIYAVSYESGKSGMFIVEFRAADGSTSAEGFYNANTRKGVFDFTVRTRG